MVGRSSLRHGEAPDEAARIALAKNENMQARAVVRITGSNSEVVGKSGARGTDFAGRPQIQVRRQGRSGPNITSRRAAALVGCRGQRGCDFARCVEGALGVIPRNLQKACRIEDQVTLTGPEPRRTRLTTGGSPKTPEQVAAIRRERFESRRSRAAAPVTGVARAVSRRRITAGMPGGIAGGIAPGLAEFTGGITPELSEFTGRMTDMPRTRRVPLTETEEERLERLTGRIL